MLLLVSRYDRGDEVTRAALLVADALESAAVSVQFCCMTRGPGAEVCRRWDRRVVRYRCVAAKTRGDCRVAVHFGCFKRWLDETPSRVKTVSVALWPRLHEDDVSALARYGAVVCPSRCCSESLEHFGRLRRDVIQHCRWPGSSGPCWRPSALPCLAVLLRRRAASDYGLRVVHFLGELLSALPLLSVTVGGAARLPGSARRALLRLDRSYKGRVRRFGDDDTVECSWFLSIPDGSAFCLDLLSALDAGAPVIAPAAPPLSEFVRRGPSGVLVECELVRGAGRLCPTPLWCNRHWGEVCLDALVKSPVPRWLPADAGATDGFTDFWSTLVS